jgi:transcriptional regulator with XRE-family HTH domain
MSRVICTYIGALMRWHMDSAYEKAFGNRIRQKREEKGLTQDNLSAKMQLQGCDITRSAIAKIEVGQRHIYPDEIKLIKEILEINYDELF